MVCDRCIYVIRTILTDMAIDPVSVRLGEVDLGDQVLDSARLAEFGERIEALGFELISDRKSRLIETVKTLIIELLDKPALLETVKLSEYLSSNLHHDYSHLSNLFSSVEGTTVEQYFIQQKIEKVKELLIYDELTLTVIADRLGYSSVAHLSRQFSKVTGQTPSQFRRLRDSRQRRPLDKP